MRNALQRQTIWIIGATFSIVDRLLT